MEGDGWTVARGGRRNKTRRTPTLPKRTSGVHWRDFLRPLCNDGRGDCWWLAPLMTYLVAEGLPPSCAEMALAKDGKNPEHVERLEELASLMRSLTVAAYLHEQGKVIESGFDQPKSANPDPKIMKLAKDLASRPSGQDWIDCILFPGGYGDNHAAELLGQVLHIPNFAVVKPIVSNGDRILSDSGAYSTMTGNMVMIHNGHFEAIVPKYDDETDVTDDVCLRWVVEYCIELARVSLDEILESAETGVGTSTDMDMETNAETAASNVEATGTEVENESGRTEAHVIAFGSFIAENDLSVGTEGTVTVDQPQTTVVDETGPVAEGEVGGDGGGGTDAYVITFGSFITENDLSVGTEGTVTVDQPGAMVVDETGPVAEGEVDGDGGGGTEAYVIEFGSFIAENDLSVGTEGTLRADQPQPTVVDETGPVVEGEVGGDGGAHAWRDELAHQNPFEPLFTFEKREDDADTDSDNWEYVLPAFEVCLGGTVWRKWIRPPQDNEVFLGETVWHKWAKVVVAGPTDWTVPVWCGKPRSRRRTGFRRSRHMNRRRREQRRRRALRHKKQCRRERSFRHRRRRVSFRGGANPEEETSQALRRGGRNRVAVDKSIKDSVKETNVYNRNLAAVSEAIHTMAGYDASLQKEMSEQRAEEIKDRAKLRETEKLLRERLGKLQPSTRSATLGDLLAFTKKDDEEPEPVCKECEQHFDGEEDKRSCDICDGVLHRDCADTDDDEVWFCPGCKKTGSAPADEVGAGEIGGGEDGDSDGVVSDDGVARVATTRLSKSPHVNLVQTGGDDEKVKIVTANLANANELAKQIKENKIGADTRNLTLKRSLEDVRALDQKKDLSLESMLRFEKHDHRLYGIAVRDLSRRDDGTTVAGTEVEFNETTWTVVSARMTGEGFKEFKLEATGKRRKDKGTTKWCNTLDILEHAKDSDAVVSLEAERKRVSLAICVSLVLGCTYTPMFIKKDPKIKRKKKMVDLEDEEKKWVMDARKFAWEQVQGAKAGDLINEHELALLASDAGLVEELGKEKSLHGYLGLDRMDIGESLVFSDKKINKDNLPTVEHYMRGAQSAYKLGRVVCWESCMAPLAAGGPHTELPPGVKLMDDELDTIKFWCQPEEVVGGGGYGLATRALLARARDSGELCKWYAHVPLYRLMLFSRPRITKGFISPTTENTSRVSPTRKHIVAFETASGGSKSKAADSLVMNALYEGYEPVAIEKKRMATLWENRRQRMGFGPKKKNGRMREPGSTEANELMLFMRKMMQDNGIDPVMHGLDEEDLNVCYRVLEADEHLIGERVDEAHLYPEAEQSNIKTVAKKLERITLEQWTTFSAALVILDATSGPCLRPQDILGCKARDFHILQGKLRAILPEDGKNAAELARSVHGLVMNHTKHSKCKGPYAVMLVVGRRLMRGLIKEKLGKRIAALKKSGASDEIIAKEEKKYVLDLGENIGPINNFGANYNGGQLRTLFQYVGKYCLGLPYFCANILRSMHVTAVLIKAIEDGKKFDDPAIKDIFALARHGEFHREKTYNAVKADLDLADGKTFVGQNYGLAGTIGEVGPEEVLEAKEGIANCVGLLDLFTEGHGFSVTGKGKTSTVTEVPPSLQSFFGQDGLAGFIKELVQKLVVPLRGAVVSTSMCVDTDPEYLEDKRREEELEKLIEREAIKERIGNLEGLLARSKGKQSDQTVTGKKRPGSATIDVVPKRERLARSKGTSDDADRLEILREMHALYIVEVEKLCIYPVLSVFTNSKREKLFGNDPQKVLKGKLRVGKPSILCVPAVADFLRDFNPELSDRFKNAFGGKGQNVTKLLDRVAKKKELPAFVWKNAGLSKCGRTECQYCE